MRWQHGFRSPAWFTTPTRDHSTGSIEFQRILKRNGVRCSMSNRGTCADNSVMESFFSSLKRERTHGRRFVTREELRRVLFEYIEVFYNRRRRHSHIGRMSPAKFEETIK